MPRFVQFTEYGDVDRLEVVDVDMPEPAAGEVRVRVTAAGLNPVDYKLREGGPAAAAFGVKLPSGNGNDFAGVVDAVGEGVTEWTVGQRVFGARRFYAQADYVIVGPEHELHPTPEALPDEVAGTLAIAGRTAQASVRAVGVSSGETVLVSAAAGGVGILACQVARLRGATVIGTASPSNHEFLRSIGVVPVAYGEGLVERVRELAPQGVDAVLDNAGAETQDAGLALGVDPARINTIADRGHAARIGAQGVGGADARADDLVEIAERLADGTFVLPIARAFPLDEVREAYRLLEGGHVRGKVVLTTS